MGKALSEKLREQIIQYYLLGLSYLEIGELTGCSISGCKKIINLWKKQDKTGIPKARYSSCGKTGLKFSESVYELCMQQKILHPSWGAGLIHAKLSDEFLAVKLPSIRSVSRWIRAFSPKKREVNSPKQAF